MKQSLRATFLAGVAAIGLSACTSATAPTNNMDIQTGPPVTDITTPYDKALVCAKDQLAEQNKTYTVAVGEIIDATGKFSTDSGGNGYYITQGAGKIMQSAFYQAQPNSVVNRTDTKVMEKEMKLGRSLQWEGSDIHATGAVTTLDFVPGGGFDVNVAGVSAKAKQFRMVVGLDISLTSTYTSKVVANTSLHKQIVAIDYGVGTGRFFGDTLVSMSIGEQRREAIGFATRSMLKLATFNLLEQVYGDMPKCREHVEEVEGVANANQMEDVKQRLERKKESEHQNRFLNKQNNR